MTCKHCGNTVLDNAKTCPFCGKNPKKEAPKGKSSASNKAGLGDINYPLAFMIVFIILGVLTIGITLLVHKSLVKDDFSYATIVKYCSTPITIGIVLIVIGILIKIFAVKGVRAALGKLMKKPKTAITIGLLLLLVGGFFAIRGFSYKESESSVLAGQVATYAEYHGDYDLAKYAKAQVDETAGKRIWEGLGGSVLAFIGFAILRGGIQSNKEEAKAAAAEAEAARQRQIDALKQRRSLDGTKTETGKKCVKCGGTLEFDRTTGKLYCPFCDSEFDLEPENNSQNNGDL